MQKDLSPQSSSDNRRVSILLNTTPKKHLKIRSLSHPLLLLSTPLLLLA